jgi:ACS family allantoate permease-like MFS transporter
MANANETATMAADMEKETIVRDDSSPPSGLKKTINDKLVKHSHDADAAMKAFEGMNGEVIELTPEKSKALLRKIDFHLMPVCLLCVYFLNWQEADLRIDHVHCLWIKLS